MRFVVARCCVRFPSPAAGSMLAVARLVDGIGACAEVLP
ncbi:hypothetical protein MYA_1507 [Burkholderia sp. KJ006]|nr:hypothetical protein MYA_1507 [Burkholderia sp. KJ006]